MIENYQDNNERRVSYARYVGVATVKVLAVNPDNRKLAECGWNVSQTDEEPQRTVTFKNQDGTERTLTRVDFLAQVQDLPGRPLVRLDFNIGKDVQFNGDGTKVKVIDKYGNTAWATKDDAYAKRIPNYTRKDGTSMPADISADYRPCHTGEEELVLFLRAYLDTEPYRIPKKRMDGTWERVLNDRPGVLTIDRWGDLLAGDASELKEYLALVPDNAAKAVLTVKRTERGAFQRFLPNVFMPAWKMPRRGTDEWYDAKREIDRVREKYPDMVYDARKVREYKVEETDVQPAEQAAAPDPFASAQGWPQQDAAAPQSWDLPPAEDDDRLPF